MPCVFWKVVEPFNSDADFLFVSWNSKMFFFIVVYWLLKENLLFISVSWILIKSVLVYRFILEDDFSFCCRVKWRHLSHCCDVYFKRRLRTLDFRRQFIVHRSAVNFRIRFLGHRRTLDFRRQLPGSVLAVDEDLLIVVQKILEDDFMFIVMTLILEDNCLVHLCYRFYMRTSC